MAFAQSVGQISPPPHSLQIVRQLIELDPGMFGMEAYDAFLKTARMATKAEALDFA